ncbi:MAG: hypothetical protein HOQ03_01170, partial [Thermoleophilia bacterium]|nr:hypothetical protein [Thermoleophilia bacterium]
PVAGGGEPKFLAGLFEGLGDWWDGLSTLEQLALIAGLAGLLGLLGMSFLPAVGLALGAADMAGRGDDIADIIRDPRKALRELTPGQVLVFFVGMVVHRVIPEAIQDLLKSKIGRVVHAPGHPDPFRKTLPIAEQKKALEYRDRVPSTPNRTDTDAFRYEAEYAGPRNYRLGKGPNAVMADGFRISDGAAVEAKHVGKPDTSPFIPGSKCYPPVREKALGEFYSELRRYKAVIDDPGTPVKGLEIMTNDERAAEFFVDALRRYGVPGRVVIRP